MVDWNKPTNASNYSTEVLPSLNDKINSAARANYGSDTNIPLGVLRLNGSTKRWEQWTGASWLARDLTATEAQSANLKLNGVSDIDLQKDGVSKLSVGDNVDVKSYLTLPNLSAPDAQPDRTILYAHDGRIAARDSASNVHFRRSSYPITSVPSNRSSGGSMVGFKCYFGDLVYVSIMVSSYQAVAGASIITWNCLPHAIVGNRIALAAQVFGGYAGFRWLPLTARCDSGTTLSLARHDGGQATAFAAGTTWILISGSYFWK